MCNLYKVMVVMFALGMMMFLAACGQQQPEAPAPAPAAVQPGAAVAEPGPAPEAQPDEQLVFVVSSFPLSLDNALANEWNAHRINMNMVETLVKFDGPDYNIVPLLAESWDFQDPQTVIFNLRQGVLFHNGDEMRASDVAFSIMRGVNSPPVRFILDTIESVDVIDDFTVQVNLNTPFVPILSHLTHPGAAINSERAVREKGDDFANHPIGTGPFQFGSMMLGNYVELVRFDDYWGEPAGVASIRLIVIPEAASRLIAVETGAAHLAFDISPHDIPRMRESPYMTYDITPIARLHFLGLNHESATAPALQDPRVRQAINHAIDVPAIIAAVYQGLGRITHGPMIAIPASLEFEGIEFNVDRALELMEEAGYADGFPLSLWVNADNQLEVDTAVILQNMLGQIGIDVEITSAEFATFLASINAGEHDAYVLSWTNMTFDPDYALTLFHGSSRPSPNRFRYHNPELDRLLDLGREEMDPALRLEIYHQAQEIIVQDMPAVFLMQAEELTALSPNLRNFLNFPVSTPRLANVYITN